MEKRWGLDLDMSAVRLMCRDGDQWVEQAQEKIDSPDIEARLERLIEPIADDGPVTLFLPRDQILYTKVKLDARSEPKSQIEQAMEGRTPYGLDELSVDWETGADDEVWVAAIARDTLDEAAAFAEVRNLKIAGYSTLFSGEDFPRLPKFDGPDLVDDEEVVAPPAQFATARVPSRPPDASVAAASAAATAKARFTPKPVAAEPESNGGQAVDTPVIEVEDATPVVQVKPPQMPLDPGLPISAPNAPPRIRSDIGAASVSGHAASLTPPDSSVRMHKHRAPISTLAVFAIAFLMTIGVAVLVWNFLPMRPSNTVKAPVETGSLQNSVAEEVGPPEEPTEPKVAFAELDGARTAPALEITFLAPPEPDAQTTPALTTIDRVAAPAAMTEPVLAALDTDDLPQVDRSTPVFQLPRFEATVQTASPFQGPEPDIDETTDSIFVSAFEVPDPAGDAIALPDAKTLEIDGLPNVTGRVVVTSEPDETTNPVASAVEQALADALTGPAGLIPTDLARSIPETAPRARPERFTEQIERQQYGGRTRSELAQLRPPARPESAQTLAADTAVQEPSEYAVATSLSPKLRPNNIAALVTAARVQQEAARVTASAAIRTPDTSGAIEAALEEDEEPANRAVRPRSLNIPTTASVARQATIENAIRLNRINLVGVYGAPTDRRALVRLSSGRYVKVKVGDRVDGGTVAQITDSELYYRKGNRTLSLQVPQG